MKKAKEKIIKLFDDKIEVLEHDLKMAVRAGMPTCVLYDEIEELIELKNEIMEIFE